MRALVTHVQAGWQRHLPVLDLGLGGARVLADDRLFSGDLVTMSFTAPTLWDPLVLRARVAWVGEGARQIPVGVAFDHKSPDAVLALYELIAALAYE